MKKLSLFIAILLISMAVNVFAGESQVSYVTNITCDGCATKIKTAMAKLDGVTTTDIDVESKVVTVTFNDETDANTIKKTINKTGFRATEKTDAKTEVKAADKECGTKSCCSTKTSDEPVKK